MSILLLLLVSIALTTMDSLFLSTVYPKFSAMVFYIGKYFYIGNCISMVLKNPGINSRLIQPDEVNLQEVEMCRPCGVPLVKYPNGRTSHCYQCDVCIHGLDHHCKWTNKCIGSGNKREFSLFLYTTFGGLLYSLILQIFFN